MPPECRAFTSRSGTGFGHRQNTPRDVISRINDAAIEALRDPALRQRFADIGPEIFPAEQQTPQALAQLQKAEIEKWWPIIKAANIRG